MTEQELYELTSDYKKLNCWMQEQACLSLSVIDYENEEDLSPWGKLMLNALRDYLTSQDTEATESRRQVANTVRRMACQQDTYPGIRREEIGYTSSSPFRRPPLKFPLPKVSTSRERDGQSDIDRSPDSTETPSSRVAPIFSTSSVRSSTPFRSRESAQLEKQIEMVTFSSSPLSL